MALNKFMILLLGFYGAYYCSLILLDYLRSKTSNRAVLSTGPVQYEIERESQPVDVLQLAGRGRDEEAVLDDAAEGGSGKKKIYTPEHTLQAASAADDTEAGYKNLGVDLGLEASSFQGVEVTSNNIKNLLKP